LKGRRKGPEYVSITTATYRKAVDKVWERIIISEKEEKKEVAVVEGKSSEELSPSPLLSESEWMTLRQVFTRGQDANNLGLTPGFLLGPRHQSLVRGRAPKHRGNYVGKVVQVEAKKNRVLVVLHGEGGGGVGVRRGDGVVFDGGKPEMQEEGGSVYNVVADNSSSTNTRQQGGQQRIWLEFGIEKKLNFNLLRPGHLVWKTSEQQLLSAIRSRYLNKSSKDTRRLPVTVTVTVYGDFNEPLVVCVEDEDGNVGKGSSVGTIRSSSTETIE